MSEPLFDKEKERAAMLHKLMKDQLDDYLDEGFDGVAFHTAGTIFAVNQAAADMFGYDIDELLYQNAMIFFPADSARKMMGQMLSQSTEPYTVAGRHKDGSLFQVLIKGRDFEAYGEPVRVVQLRKHD